MVQSVEDSSASPAGAGPSPISYLPSPSTSLGDDEMWALRGVSFEVKRGEILGIIGRNGAGKSTLLKILSRVTAPSRGEVRVKGRIASLLEVGTGFHPELTGRENIYLNGAILGMTKAEIKRKFDEIVDFSGVEKFLDTPVKRYSSGMYVRLAFAVAAHLEPEILIVDEVLAVGDAEFQKKCLGKMKDVAGHGRTVLFVSHNMGAVVALCGRGLLLTKGCVSYSGLIENCIQNYLIASSVEKPLKLEECRLSEYKRVHRAIEFVDVRCENGNGLLGYGSDHKFVLTLLSSDGVSNTSIGGAIYDAAGAAIGTFFTEHCVSVPAKKATKVLVSLSLPELVPGHYSAGFSIGKGSEAEKRVDYDVVIGIPTFEVAAVGRAGVVSDWGGTWGRLCLSSRVSIEPTV